jgi:hypothetical protein
MSSFINNLINRSVATETSIQPRLRGKFEQTAALSEISPGHNEIVSDRLHSVDETTIQPQRTDLIQRTHLTKLIEEHSEVIAPSVTKNFSQKNREQSIPDAKIERPPRFEPSYNLVAQKSTQQQNSSEKNVESVRNVDQQHNTQPDGAMISAIENNPQKVATAPQASTITTKEVYQPSPLVKPTTNNAFHIETNNAFHIEQRQKARLSQSPVASFIQKNIAKPASSRTINISIGRIEVRVSQPSVTYSEKPKKESVPIMGLDEYLQKRNQRSK